MSFENSGRAFSWRETDLAKKEQPPKNGFLVPLPTALHGHSEAAYMYMSTGYVRRMLVVRWERSSEADVEESPSAAGCVL